MSEVNASQTAIALAEEHGLDLSIVNIEGSGPGGKIYLPDVEELIEQGFATELPELHPLDEAFISGLRFTDGEKYVYHLMHMGRGNYRVSVYCTLDQFAEVDGQVVAQPESEPETADPGIPIPAQVAQTRDEAPEDTGEATEEEAGAPEGDAEEIEPQVQVSGEDLEVDELEIVDLGEVEATEPSE